MMITQKKLQMTAGSNALQKIILLVDDDEDEHEIFLSALRNIDNSQDLICATSCDEALDVLKELEPDYIFIDVNMPRKNGITCLQEIKKIDSLAHVPAYMYSTGINAFDRQRALQMGAVDYLIKPNSISSLCILLRKIIYQLPF